MKRSSFEGLLLILLILLFFAHPSAARIKLAALPQRELVEIQLDNSNFTLAEEERIVPLLKSTPRTGNNMIDFSWSNTQIDKNSIQFRPLAVSTGESFRPLRKVSPGEGSEMVDEVNVISVSYPPGENALVWEVYAYEACAVKVRVSYLISNLSRRFSYRAYSNKDETMLALRNYLELTNYSGEDFGISGVWAGFGEQFKKEIGQQEEIRMLIHLFKDVPIEKTFDFNWYKHGPLNQDKPFASKILMHYKLTNDEEHAMGLFPLQPGKVRIFIDDGHGGQAFLGEDWASLTPLDSEMVLYLGEARDIICTRTIEENERHHVRGNLYNQEIVIKYEMENYKEKPVTLKIVEEVNKIGQEYFGNTHGDVEWEIGNKTSGNIQLAYDQGQALPELQVILPAKTKGRDDEVKKETARFHFTIKNLW
ncbi:MAG: hypothetical protein ACMUIU_16310 [bacterium]